MEPSRPRLWVVLDAAGGSHPCPLDTSHVCLGQLLWTGSTKGIILQRRVLKSISKLYWRRGWIESNMTTRVSGLEALGWAAVGLVLIALGIPWFLWGVDDVYLGLPIWVWWHVGWMLLASAAFTLFASRAWGLGVEGIHRG